MKSKEEKSYQELLEENKKLKEYVRELELQLEVMENEQPSRKKKKPKGEM